MLGWAFVLLLIVGGVGLQRWRSGATQSLPHVLTGAVGAGIITPAQRDAILAHADTHHRGFHLDGTAWLAIIAGLFVVAGVSLLIATNWEEIGPATRVGAFLVLLYASGEATIRLRHRGRGWSIVLELLWLFLPLLGIGLYAQTFQLSGDPIRPWIVWLALTAPLAWASARPVVAAIHTGAMTVVLFAGNFFGWDLAAPDMGGGARHGMLTLTGSAAAPSAWLLSAVFLGAVAVQSGRLLPRGHRHHFVGVWAFWAFAVLVGAAPFRLDHEGWIAVAALALATAWVVVLAAMDTSLEERSTSIVVWLAILYALGFAWHVDRAAHGVAPAAGIAVVVLATVGALAGIVTLSPHRLSPIASWATAAKVALTLPLLLALLLLLRDVRFVWFVGVAMNFVLAGIAVGAMWHGSLVRDPRQVNLGVLLLVLLLATRFLDVFGSMIQSGVGFIVAGIALAGLSWALDRTRRRLIAGPETAS